MFLVTQSLPPCPCPICSRNGAGLNDGVSSTSLVCSVIESRSVLIVISTELRTLTMAAICQMKTVTVTLSILGAPTHHSTHHPPTLLDVGRIPPGLFVRARVDMPVRARLRCVNGSHGNLKLRACGRLPSTLTLPLRWRSRLAFTPAFGLCAPHFSPLPNCPRCCAQQGRFP